MAGPKEEDADRENEEGELDRTNEERHDRDDDNRFSQRDDDRAGRNWHGMNSDYEIEDVGRFHPDQDEDDERRGRYRTQANGLHEAEPCGS